ncbi:MAG: carbon-nitrogen hydrolase family protein [Myxococcales bacterium]|nr:carbon-nitrogen hydrolase family protein [Myxococcales bacterium]
MSTKERSRFAVVQVTSTEEVGENLAQAAALVRRAADAGAELVALPENVGYLRHTSVEAYAEPIDGRIATHFRELARELGCHVLLGSFPEQSESPTKAYNTSLLIDGAGEIVARYRKLHLFDIEIPGRESHRESDRVLAGGDVVTCDTPFGRLGLSICYDLRFPELYRALTLQGAEVIFVPAAFTLTTGKDHWLALLRARAIENQVYVVAPGQFGFHGGKRISYGHSVIIDPWGIVLAQVGDQTGFAIAEIDRQQQRSIRQQIPCLGHRHRLFGGEKA